MQAQQLGFLDPQSDILNQIQAGRYKTLQEIAELKAAGVADYMNFGVLLTPQFEREILDIARRRGVFGQLLDAQQSPAVGHPHRWFEQYGLPNGQAFSDPRSITVTAANNGTALRNEKSAFVRASTGQINFGLFDQQTAAQTSIFPQLVAKDLKDMLEGLYQQQDLGLFTGNAANLTDGATVQYCSLATQISNTIQINPGTAIVQTIRTKIASMMASTSVVVKPTHILLNPLLLDLIEQEIANASTTMKMVAAGEVEVLPGITVSAINTVAGKMPLVPCWEMPTRASGVSGATTDYPIAIVTMNLIERAWVGSPDIQLYKLGLVSDLADKYVAVRFDTGAIVKAGQYAHAYGYVSR